MATTAYTITSDYAADDRPLLELQTGQITLEEALEKVSAIEFTSGSDPSCSRGINLEESNSGRPGKPSRSQRKVKCMHSATHYTIQLYQLEYSIFLSWCKNFNRRGRTSWLDG